ncbi:MAG: carboxylating nicotinate-nucleotide diphosphorylase [Deltaproteobacteria bacterium]|nr:MAG: carboxylating nicotinate-nucleotide diphosphorylase [Deltaproteobacteria bacterium]
MDRDAILRLALAEDGVGVGPGDLTSRITLPPGIEGEGVIGAKGSFLLAGIEVAARVFHLVDPELRFTPHAPDGTPIRCGEEIATISGRLASILAAERVALNYLQHLSGVATKTARMVEEIADLPARIVDTRKTTPLMRRFEKDAVRVGGGFNHRFNLNDGILIKDNHKDAVGSLGIAVRRARQEAPHTMRIEVEVTTLSEVEEALAAGADLILLDNMTLEEMKRAVERIDGRALVEASGGITLEKLRAVASTGVDFISVGALTHSVDAVDISLRLRRTSAPPLGGEDAS